MSSQLEASTASKSLWQQAMEGSLLWLFVITMTLGMTLILSLTLVSGAQVSVTLGEPASQAVVAPYSITYQSEVLTNQERQRAADSVPDIYTGPTLSIGRDQDNRARAIFNFIEVVRADTLADQPTKIRYLQAIEGVTIEPQVAQELIGLSQTEYTRVKTDILNIVQEAMRQEIRENAVGEARRAARGQVSFDWTPAQEVVVTNIAPQFIVANSFFDEEATAQARLEAMAVVEPVERTVTQGEQIVQVGRIITEVEQEMLAELGLLQRETDWRRVASIFIVSLLAVTIITLYWQQFHSELHNTSRYLLLLVLLLLLFTLGAKLMVPGRGPLAYIFPAAALSMLLAVIFDVRLSMVVTVVMAAVIGRIANDSLELAIYTAVGGLIAVLTLHDTQRINALFRAGLVAAVANMAVILVFRLPQDIGAVELTQLLLFALANGLISASLTLAGFFIIGSLFGVITTLQLQELSRLDHPLLQELLRRAPGTYHHSIMVANLAEQGAERIKANSALVRVGAFYHDVGKMNRPPFYTENQEGVNPHESLDPYSSARIILSHVSDGLQLARRYRLPNRIRDFIAEHHGNRVLKVFYNTAQETAGAAGEPVEIDRFRYRGPRPRSRETGIVQLADTIEATSSALRPNTEADIERLVNSIVDEHLKEGQLDNAGLTLGDIRRLRESFTETLKGRFHVRVRYPGNETMAGDGEPRPADMESMLTTVSRPQGEEAAPSQEEVEEVDEVVRH